MQTIDALVHSGLLHEGTGRVVCQFDCANDTEMGLTGYVYTTDPGKGLAVSERIQAGMVGLNRGSVSGPVAPLGGMKQSGLGREGASEGIYEFCETQYIAASW